MRITISSQSLNYLIGTFQASNSSTITQPIKTLISPPQSGENGVYSATFDNQVDSGMPRTFNNALTLSITTEEALTIQIIIDTILKKLLYIY